MAGKKSPKPASKGHHKGKSQRLSLYPLDLETALGAALQTGRAPETKKKSSGKRRKSGG